VGRSLFLIIKSKDIAQLNAEGDHFKRNPIITFASIAERVIGKQQEITRELIDFVLGNVRLLGSESIRRNHLLAKSIIHIV